VFTGWSRTGSFGALVLARCNCASRIYAARHLTPRPFSPLWPAVLLKFKNFAAQREAFHKSSYFLALGIPGALLLGEPISTLVDVVGGVVIPLHFHLGMRSVIIDYVHDVPVQRLALGTLAGVTVLTIFGLTVFNFTDVGLTGAIKAVYTHQPEPKTT
jgi:succinate dehydrogenase hydrophobic anchor subunit